MRTGVNPQKGKAERNIPFQHRVIIPVHIPTLEEEFYKEAYEIFEISLKSLLQTVNLSTTCLTVINNASVRQVDDLINRYIKNGLVDKKVNYHENRGKVFAVLNEARGAYEPFLTIADADVFFFNGWEEAVFAVFEDIPRAGIVAPVPSPHMAFYNNSSVFFDHFAFNRIGYGKIVHDNESELFLKGIGNSALFNRNNRNFSWKEKQYYFKKFPEVLLGAGHFVATYRAEIFKDSKGFPEVKFANGLEEEFIDGLADKVGLYRLSTSVCYAYHVGNEIEDWIMNYSYDGSKIMREEQLKRVSPPPMIMTPYIVRNAIFKFLKKMKRL